MATEKHEKEKFIEKFEQVVILLFFQIKRVISSHEKCVYNAQRGDMGSFRGDRCFCLRNFTTEIVAEKENFSRARLFFEFFHFYYL